MLVRAVRPLSRRERGVPWASASAERPPVCCWRAVGVLGFPGPEDVRKAQLGLDRHLALSEFCEVLPGLVHGPVVPIAGMAKQAEAELEEGSGEPPGGRGAARSHGRKEIGKAHD